MKLIYHAQMHEGHAILINFDTPEMKPGPLDSGRDWDWVGSWNWILQFATVVGPLPPHNLHTY